MCDADVDGFARIGQSNFRLAADRESGDSVTFDDLAGVGAADLNHESIGFQYGGIEPIKVLRFDGPTMSTAHAKVSGVNVTPASAA